MLGKMGGGCVLKNTGNCGERKEKDEGEKGKGRRER